MEKVRRGSEGVMKDGDGGWARARERERSEEMRFRDAWSGWVAKECVSTSEL